MKDKNRFQLSDDGKVTVSTNLSLEEITSLPENCNHVMQDLLCDGLTDRGRDGAHAILNLVNQFIPNLEELKTMLRPPKSKRP